MEPIVNRVAESDLKVFNLEELWDGNEVVELDVAPWLYEGMIVREKDFRESVKNHPWSDYTGQHVAVFCSADAIVPTWAFMLVASRLESVAASVALGQKADLVRNYFSVRIAAMDLSEYEDGLVVIKGCGSGIVPVEAYVDAMQRMQGVAKKIMYGEPCSSVPLWRRK
ncbi:MAG: DUF2480 family protein [Bacteroidetes bacterium]|nr:MAG: DUF2480 family protein [Bacteroidota bacterium]